MNISKSGRTIGQGGRLWEGILSVCERGHRHRWQPSGRKCRRRAVSWNGRREIRDRRGFSCLPAFQIRSEAARFSPCASNAFRRRLASARGVRPLRTSHLTSHLTSRTAAHRALARVVRRARPRPPVAPHARSLRHLDLGDHAPADAGEDRTVFKTIKLTIFMSSPSSMLPDYLIHRFLCS